MKEMERLKINYNWEIHVHATCNNGIWFTNKRRSFAVNYPETGNEDCAEAEQDSYWFQHRSKVICSLLRNIGLPSVLWEVGSGNGFMSASIEALGTKVVAIEPGEAGARAALARGIAHSICGLLEELDLPTSSIPMFGCFDVLEHVENPENLIKEMHRLLEPGGRIIVTVPGLPCLWSQVDEFAGHFRRYTPKALDNLFKRCNFQKVYSGYFMMSLVPAIYWLRTRPYRKGIRNSTEEIKKQGATELTGSDKKYLLQMLKYTLSLEHRLMNWIPLPYGSSVIGVYKIKS